jgi:hypothetical protein
MRSNALPWAVGLASVMPGASRIATIPATAESSSRSVTSKTSLPPAAMSCVQAPA